MNFPIAVEIIIGLVLLVWLGAAVRALISGDNAALGLVTPLATTVITAVFGTYAIMKRRNGNGNGHK